MKHLNAAGLGSYVREAGPITIDGDVKSGTQIEITAGSLVITGNVGANVTIKCTADITTSMSSHTPSDLVMGTDKSGSVTIRGNVADNVDIKYAGRFVCIKTHPTATITKVVSRAPSTYNFQSNQSSFFPSGAHGPQSNRTSSGSSSATNNYQNSSYNSFAQSRTHNAQPNPTLQGSSSASHYQDSSNVAKRVCTTGWNSSPSDDRNMHPLGKSHPHFNKK